MNSPTVLECSGLVLSHGEELVLQGASLRVKGGSLLPLIGPNGSGKTTLLRALLGLLPPRGGSIIHRFGHIPPAYVPQQKRIDPLYPVSLRDIVLMGLYPELGFWRRPNQEQRHRFEQVLRRFHLEEHQDKTFDQLSGGMRQKTLIARAFLSRAPLIVLDEPTAGLDAASERDLLKHLVDINRRGRTILLAHHRLEDLSHLAEQVCLVDRKTVTMLPAGEAWKHMGGSLEEDAS